MNIAKNKINTLKLLNQTKNTELSKNIKFLNKIYQKAIGLMFSFKRNDFALIFKFNKEKRICLHMFFVFYPIDVLYLSKEKKVVEIINNFKPFTTYCPKHRAIYVIELPNGKIKQTRTEINDIIMF